MAEDAPERCDKKRFPPPPRPFFCAARNICLAGETRYAPGIVGDVRVYGRSTVFRPDVLRTGTDHRYSENITWPQYKKAKYNDLEPHFQTSATLSRCLRVTKTATVLPHCRESTKDPIAGWYVLRLAVTPELCQNCGIQCTKYCSGRRGFRSAFMAKFGPHFIFFSA